MLKWFDRHQIQSEIFQSSAYNNNFEHTKCGSRSFIYSRNNKGPKFDFWRIPEVDVLRKEQ